MAYNWQNLSTRLLQTFGKWAIYKRLVVSTYDESTGEPIMQYEEDSIRVQYEPIKKKGSIGGENELQYVTSDFGDSEKGAFIAYTTYRNQVKELDELKDLTINGINYGDFIVDRIQNWSFGNGIYKFRLLTKSMFPSHTDWENQSNGEV